MSNGRKTRISASAVKWSHPSVCKHRIITQPSDQYPADCAGDLAVFSSSVCLAPTFSFDLTSLITVWQNTRDLISPKKSFKKKHKWKIFGYNHCATRGIHKLNNTLLTYATMSCTYNAVKGSSKKTCLLGKHCKTFSKPVVKLPLPF